MSTDTLRFEGHLGKLFITACCVEGSPRNRGARMGIVICRDGDEVYADNQKVKDRIIKHIRSGFIKMKYMGGYSSNGDYWGAEDTRWRFET